MRSEIIYSAGWQGEPRGRLQELALQKSYAHTIGANNALRHSVAKPGDLVAVQGLGGLGHLGIQFANRFGFRTVAVSCGKDKERLARELGADEYIDTEASDPAAVLTLQ